jgi:predicted nucleotide-binding protein
MAAVVDQEFVAHLFAFENGPGADDAYRQLTGVWAACREQLGMSVPIPELEVAGRPPRRRQDLPPGGFLAAQQSTGTPNRQAVLRRAGGTLNLSVLLAQPQPERTGLRRLVGNGNGPARLGWVEFAQLWSRVGVGGTDALLGHTAVLVARTQTKRGRPSAASPALGRSLTDVLPHDEARDGNWWDSVVTTADGLGVWDTGRAQRIGPRELVVLAPPDADQELSRWVWFDQDAHLPPLAEYLLESAVLRYHARVLDGWNAVPRLTDVDGVIREIAATFERQSLSDSRPELLRSYLDRLQANEFHLATLIERLQRIIDQTGIALRQMPNALGASGAMLPKDMSLAQWLLGQVSAEQAHQRSHLNSTMHTHRLVAAELDRSTRAAEGSRAPAVGDQASADQPEDVRRKVFVVHGRDERVKETFFSFLQALDLRPQDWELLVNATAGTSPNIVDVVRRAPEIAQATVVLMTPDDTVQLRSDLAGAHDPDQETAVGCQARPNVLLELGMALMAYPERTIVVEIGALRSIGDLAGLNVIRFDGSGRAIAKVISRLRAAGCPVDDSDTSWKDASRFAGLDAFTRGPHPYD